MNGGATNKTIDAVLDALGDLGQNIEAVYLYGSLSNGTYQPGQSDINLLIVLDEEESFHQARKVLRPVWCNFGPVLKRTPLIATQSTLRRHLSFNPGLSRHLNEYGSLLAGHPCLPEPLTRDPIERLSEMARIAMHGSAAITPSLLSERENAGTISCLRSLSRQLFDHEVSEDEHATALFSQIQADILSKMEQHPSLFWKDQPISGAPPLVKDLRGIYEHENRLVLLLPDSGPEDVARRIKNIDWNAVAGRIISQYRGLWVTTAAQLRMIMLYDSPAAYQLGSYNHAWGLDPLVDLKVDAWRIFRNFGRSPSTLLVDTLPQAYTMSEDSDLAMMVHNLHNKLLNVQLKNEIYCRMQERPIAKPPGHLTDRDLPMEKRIDGIYNHLDWWSGHYANEMATAQT
ncbi:MAG TPA: nucleotidyltransferase domain-containing protein [Patescibacteria group bacterium]|nr:nucleotidyltransferase domain-containing protein [Patescibacteria group bacterium]